jgi:hypothetical protein
MPKWTSKKFKGKYVERKKRVGALFWLAHINRDSSMRGLFVQEEKEMWWKARLSFESDGVFWRSF